METINDNKIESLNKNLKLLIFFVIILIVLVSCFFVAFIVFNNKKDLLEVNNQETTTAIKDSKLYELGVDFYENFYYKDCGQGDDNKRINFLKQYKDKGIKVSLDNILRYYVTTNKYMNSINSDLNLSVYDRVNKIVSESFSNYDLDNTKVVIYPKEPYGEKDYTIEVEIKNK